MPMFYATVAALAVNPIGITLPSLIDIPLTFLGDAAIPTMVMVLGIQLFSLGLLGELIIFTHGKKMQHYHVDKVYEFGRQP